MRLGSAGRGRRRWPSGIGVVLGFYDGFFGPGTGSFFVFLFVRLLGALILKTGYDAFVR